MLKKDAKGELAFAGSLLALGLVVLYDTYNMEVPPGSGTVGPQIFPYLISGFTIILAISLAIQVLRGNLGQPEGTEFGDVVERTDYKTLALVAGSMLTYPLLVESAGFVVASVVAFFGVSYAFGSKKLLKNFLIALIFSLVVYVTFTKLLSVELPAGILKGIL